jgi:outer membrane protein OmpA-like peptidoglycan-associated protein
MRNRHTTRVCAALLTLTLAPAAAIAFQDCEQASKLNDKAFHRHSEDAPVAELKSLLNRAIALCPNHPESHNNLADMLREERRYAEAIAHYKRALMWRDFSEAWNGLGETYYLQNQLPLSLEAHLHACKTDEDSQLRIKELLEKNRYAITEENQILNKESLLLLYDETRREEIDDLLANCGLKAKIRYMIVFRSLVFNSGKATLKRASKTQLNKIAEVLKIIQPRRIKIGGHSDNQRWRRKTLEESKQLNLALSQRRADTVKNGLTKQGIHEKRVQAKGYGGSHPLVYGNSKAAWAKNRRVEIEVK